MKVEKPCLPLLSKHRNLKWYQTVLSNGGLQSNLWHLVSSSTVLKPNRNQQGFGQKTGKRSAECFNLEQFGYDLTKSWAT